MFWLNFRLGDLRSKTIVAYLWLLYLKYQAMVGDMAGAMFIITELLEFTNADTHISYLPLAHSFERLIVSVVFNAGARVGFYRGVYSVFNEF